MSDAWDNLKLDSCLFLLSNLKKVYEDKPKSKAWRPTGRPVDEQLAPLYLFMFNHQAMVLQKKIEVDQLPELERLFSMVEKKREELEQHMQAKKNMMQIFEQKNDRMNKTVCQLHDLQKELTD